VAVVAIKFWNIKRVLSLLGQSASTAAPAFSVRLNRWGSATKEAAAIYYFGALRPELCRRQNCHARRSCAPDLFIVNVCKLVQRRQFYHSFARRALRRKGKDEGRKVKGEARRPGTRPQMLNAILLFRSPRYPFPRRLI
jgi:hypothetical protein